MNQPGTEADVPISHLVRSGLLPDRRSHRGKPTIPDSKDQKTTIILEAGQVAVVLGMEDGQISRQLFVSPDVDTMLDDEHSDIPFQYLLASAVLVRLDQDEDFASDLAEWYDERPQGEAGTDEDRS
jgi:hypothetical protein